MYCFYTLFIYLCAELKTQKLEIMNEKKFFIGDEVFYMAGDQPKKATVVGTVTFDGNVSTLNFSYELKPGESVRVLCFGLYSYIEESKCFASKGELFAHLDSLIK